jgi:outer membrane lipoprotein-sorting protein
VSDLAEAIELMHTSIGRWRTLRAGGREWRHLARAREAWERWILRGRSGTVTYLGEPEGEPEPAETEERWRLWLAKPNRTRAEFTVEEEMVTVVSLGDTWWSWSPTRRVTTNAGDPRHSHGTGPGQALIDPASILPAVELEVAGRSTFLGRPVLEVTARPSPLDEDDEEAPEWRSATHGLGSGADDYRLLVDTERGVLLRSEALIGDEPFRVLEMKDVAFDEDLPEQTFTPPEAVDIERVEAPRTVSLEDLPGTAPFVVLVPERPPFGPPDARIEPSDGRYGIPEQIHIDYASPVDGEEDQQFWLIESADPIPERTGVDWRKEGGIRLGEDRRVRPALRIARLERLGTHVEIQSYWLGMKELLQLARSLVPLPPEPPALS